VAEPDAVELPIFELPLALVPDERVPLHIFEPRYRAMIGACLEDETPFGIVLADDLGPREVGCSARVTDVAERFDDGRMNVVCRGESRFRVVERFEADEWPAGVVEMLAPAPAAPAGPELDAARAAFADLLEAVGAEAARAEAASGAYPIAAQIELPPQEKQELLEQEDERERLVAIEGFLRRLLSGITRAREIAERAKSNGHGKGRIGPIG
jgi:ATP-dependent Lon protease